MARPRPASRPPRPTAAASEADATALAPVLEPEGRALLDSLAGYREADALAVSS
ncbi:SAM-dependent methyltransferase, partial [Micrococcus luteus]|nr:SAM-dependent methyltransferase [Micrococcus luteus]